jgi:hypothetical protein
MTQNSSTSHAMGCHFSNDRGSIASLQGLNYTSNTSIGELASIHDHAKVYKIELQI